MSVLWKVDGDLANRPAPAKLAESESWANGEKTDRFGERFGDRLEQESPMKQPTRENERSLVKNCWRVEVGERFLGGLAIEARAESRAGGARIRASGERRRDLGR